MEQTGVTLTKATGCHWWLHAHFMTACCMCGSHTLARKPPSELLHSVSCHHVMSEQVIRQQRLRSSSRSRRVNSCLDLYPPKPTPSLNLER